MLIARLVIQKGRRMEWLSYGRKIPWWLIIVSKVKGLLALTFFGMVLV